MNMITVTQTLEDLRKNYPNYPPRSYEHQTKSVDV